MTDFIDTITLSGRSFLIKLVIFKVVGAVYLQITCCVRPKILHF